MDSTPSGTVNACHWARLKKVTVQVEPLRMPGLSDVPHPDASVCTGGSVDVVEFCPFRRTAPAGPGPVAGRANSTRAVTTVTTASALNLEGPVRHQTSPSALLQPDRSSPVVGEDESTPITRSERCTWSGWGRSWRYTCRPASNRARRSTARCPSSCWR